MATIEWKGIKSFQGYFINTLGQIKSFKQCKEGKLLSLKTGTRGYIVVTLYKDGRRFPKLVHRLVYETFVGEIPDDREIDHINRDKTDNSLDNLRLVSPSENCRNRGNHRKIIQLPQHIIYDNLSCAAEQTGFNYSHIRECCEGTRKITGNSYFFYYDENINYNNLNLPKTNGKTTNKPVTNIDTKISYESIGQAAMATGIAKSNIARCCKGERKTAGGYHWKYKED